MCSINSRSKAEYTTYTSLPTVLHIDEGCYLHMYHLAFFIHTAYTHAIKWNAWMLNSLYGTFFLVSLEETDRKQERKKNGFACFASAATQFNISIDKKREASPLRNYRKATTTTTMEKCVHYKKTRAKLFFSLSFQLAKHLSTEFIFALRRRV